MHCGGFAVAAPLRAWTLVSVSISGLPLSWPVRIKGLVGHYPANSLIRRRLILEREFQGYNIPVRIPYQELPSVSRAYP